MDRDFIIDTIIPLLIIIGLIMFFRLIIISSFDLDDYCELKYGEDFYGGLANDMPNKINDCVKVYKNGSIERYYFSDKEYFKHCESPAFFNILEWRDKCG